MAADRIAFAEAIIEPRLLKPRFDDLSFPQRCALKIMYGVPLDPRVVEEQTGFSEFDYWSIFHDYVQLDDLGYPLKVLPGAPIYVPREYREAIVIIGRRAGKTDAFGATIVAYEATCGGHERYLRPRQQGICFQIAQDLRMARNSLHFIRGVLETSPLLMAEIIQITADRIDLKNHFSICCVPATLKSVRGFASPVGVMDEMGVWYQEAESANPDYEVYRALSPGQIQFPDRKIVGISSPWNKAGLLYQYYEAGTEGFRLKGVGQRAIAEHYEDVVVLHGPTAVMGNPQVNRPYLKRERQRDERAFEREVLAQFQDSISGFIPTSLVELSRDAGILERPYDPRWTYYAAMDPAFKRDAFAFTIVHNEKGTIVQDVVRRFMGAPATPLNPGMVLDAIIPLIQQYGLNLVYSDQYHMESLGQLLRDRGGIEIVGVTFTAKSKAELYGNLQQLFLQRKVRLLDDYETIREVKSLERTLTAGGGVSVSAPVGLHDDVASVVCLAAAQAMWSGQEMPPKKDPKPQETYHTIIQAQIQRRWNARQEPGPWD